MAAARCERRAASGERQAASGERQAAANWICFVIRDTEEFTEEDQPIDIQTLESVTDGSLKLASKPFSKETWNPYGPVRNMVADNPLFVRETMVFANTVMAVVK